MVQIASFAVVTAILASQAAAITTCVPNQIYCGFTLLSGNDFNTWKPRVDKALRDKNQPQDGTHENDSLFRCVTPATLEFVDWCIDNGAGVRCQPNVNDNCRRLSQTNDCCAA